MVKLISLIAMWFLRVFSDCPTNRGGIKTEPRSLFVDIAPESKLHQI
jgi:hypothetical protein